MAGDLPRALAEYRITCDLDRDRLQRAPVNEQWQADFANSANRLGVVLRSRGDFTGARSAFDEDLQMRRRLVQTAPDDARRQRRLAVSLAYASSLHQATGDAVQAASEEAALTAKLAAGDPSNAETTMSIQPLLQDPVSCVMRHACSQRTDSCYGHGRWDRSDPFPESCLDSVALRRRHRLYDRG